MSTPTIRELPSYPRAAWDNRRRFDAAGVTVVNVVGAAGSGKTSLLEAVARRMSDRLRLGLVLADPAAAPEAATFEAAGIPVVQVFTQRDTYVSAAQVQGATDELPLDQLDLLLIENVGNAIQPGRVDLGQHLRIAVMSITDGPQQLSKYADLYRDAALVLLSKYDLVSHVDFDLDATVEQLQRLNPAAEVICTDARNRVGIDRLAGWLLGYVRAQRPDVRQRESLFEPAGV